MIAGIAKIVTGILSVLPIIDKVLPVAKQVAALTTFTKVDDAAVAKFEELYSGAKARFSDRGAKFAALFGIQTLEIASDLGFTTDEAQEAVRRGLLLEHRARELRKGFRKKLVAGEVVVLGDRTLTAPGDLKAIDDSYFRLLAEAEFNANKAVQ